MNQSTSDGILLNGQRFIVSKTTKDAIGLDGYLARLDHVAHRTE